MCNTKDVIHLLQFVTLKFFQARCFATKVSERGCNTAYKIVNVLSFKTARIVMMNMDVKGVYKNSSREFQLLNRMKILVVGKCVKYTQFLLTDILNKNGRYMIQNDSHFKKLRQTPS